MSSIVSRSLRPIAIAASAAILTAIGLVFFPDVVSAQCDPTAGHVFSFTADTGMASLSVKALQRTPGKAKTAAQGTLELRDGTRIPVAVTASVRALDQPKTDYKFKALDRATHVGGVIRLEGCPPTITKARLTIRTATRVRWKLKDAAKVALVATTNAKTLVLEEADVGGILADQTDATHVVFVSGDSTLGSLAVGSVLLAGVTSATPHGMLRTVLDIVPQGAVTVVITEPSTLLDAFDQLDIELTSTSVRQVGARGPRFNVNADGTVHLGGFQQSVNHDFFDSGGTTLNLSGELSVDSSLNLGIHTSSFLGIPHLDSAHLEITGNVSAALQASASYGASVSGDVMLADVPLGVFTIGPIVLTPNFKLVGGVAATLNAGIVAEVHGSWSPMVGVMCDGGCEPEHLVAHTIDGSVTVNANASAEAFLRPELELALYDTVGAHVGVQPFANLTADVHADPWWTLKGGVKGDVGLGVSILGHQVAGYDKDFTIFEIEILHATTPPPQPPPADTCAPTQAECESNCSLNCGTPSCLQAADGQFCCVPAGQDQHCNELPACTDDSNCEFNEKCVASGPCASPVCVPLCYGGVRWGCCMYPSPYVDSDCAVEHVTPTASYMAVFKRDCEAQSQGGHFVEGRCPVPYEVEYHDGVTRVCGEASCCIGRGGNPVRTDFGPDSATAEARCGTPYNTFMAGRCPYLPPGSCDLCSPW